MIKNLAQLKKALAANAEFEITMHRRPECIGHRRKVTVANTQGIYSIDLDDPEGKVSQGNNGKGAFLDWAKASDWEFKDGLCTRYCQGEHTKQNLVITIKVKEAI